MCLPRSFFRSYPAWRGPYWHGLCLLSARTRTATSEAVKPLGGGGQGDQRLDDLAHPHLVEIDAADKSFADLRGEGEMFEHFISPVAFAAYWYARGRAR